MFFWALKAFNKLHVHLSTTEINISETKPGYVEELNEKNQRDPESSTFSLTYEHIHIQYLLP